MPKKENGGRDAGRQSINIDQTAKCVYEKEQVHMMVTKDRLEILCSDIIQKVDGPKYDDAWPWFAISMALLLALIPADFKDFAGVPKDTWLAIALLGVILSTWKGSSLLIQAFKAKGSAKLSAHEMADTMFRKMTENHHENNDLK